jgi:hypothetical protein
LMDFKNKYVQIGRVDDAIVNWTGAGMPLGLLASGNGSLVSVGKESGQAANTIVAQNVKVGVRNFHPRREVLKRKYHPGGPTVPSNTDHPESAKTQY